MVKIDGSISRLFVSSHHVITEVFNQLALLLKSHQLLLVLVPNIITIGWVECCKIRSQVRTKFQKVDLASYLSNEEPCR